jgi:dsDNA-specific endonuclease/ATPase MutS2
MKFHLNERVAFLNEIGYAVIKSISNSKITIEDEHGFERQVHATELVKIIIDEFTIEIPNEKIQIDRGIQKRNKVPSKKEKKKQTNSNNNWEIDLHLENLPNEILSSASLHYIEMQMKALRYFIEKVKKNRIKSFIVIHGVGDGILKDEVMTYLSRYDSFKFSAADGSIYGRGATQVTVMY